MDSIAAERLALQLVTGEVGLQNGMWGDAERRKDIINGELLCAGMGQLDATFDRRNGFSDEDAFGDVPMIYPENWSGFRSYGGDIPNIVVAAAFLVQEIKRLLMNGEDPTRLACRPDQTYNPETGIPNTEATVS